VNRLISTSIGKVLVIGEICYPPNFAQNQSIRFLADG